MSKVRKPDFTDLTTVVRGGKFDVLMNSKVQKAYDRLKRKYSKDFGRIQRALQNFAQFGWSDLPVEQFTWEGRFPSGVAGQARVRVGVIKGWQARLYGGTGRVNGRPAFIAVEFARKKRDSANQDILRSAAQKLARYSS